MKGKCCLAGVVWMLMATGNIDAQIRGADRDPGFFPLPAATGEDVRNNALGGTGVAGTQGANAIFTNPALLGALSKSSIQVGGRVNLGTITDNYSSAQYRADSAQFSSKYRPTSKLTHISFAMPVALDNPDLSCGIGIGYNTAIDLSRSLDLTFTDAGGNWQSAQRNYGGLNIVSPAVSFGYKNRFFAGIALNKSINGDITYDRVLTDPNGHTDEYTSDRSASAFYATLGAMIDVSQRVSIGCSYIPAHNLSYDDLLATYKTDGKVTVIDSGSADSTVTVALPGIFAVGVQVKLSSSFLLVMEYQDRRYADYEVDLVKQVPHIINGSVWAGGVEYNGPVSARLGISAQSIPLADDYSERSPKTLTTVTAGVGIPVDSLAMINFSAGYGYFELENKLKLNGNERKYTYDESNFRLDLGVTFNLPPIK